MADRFYISPTADSVPFDNDTNGFIADDVQAAIEEARDGNTTLGRSFVIPFSNNGNTANKWISHIPTSEASDTLPYHSAWDLEIFGVGFSNKNTNIDCDVQIYINGTAPGDLMYTLQVRNFRYYHETTLSSLFSVSIGDSISIFIKKVGASTPSSVEIDLFSRISSTTVGLGGSN